MPITMETSLHDEGTDNIIESGHDDSDETEEEETDNEDDGNL